MIPILQNIKNLKLISFLSSKPLSNRTGSSFLSTTSGNTVSLSNQFSAVMVNPFLKIPSALYVGLHITTFTTIMAVTVNTSVKSVDRPSAPAKSLQHLFALPALTVEIPSFQKKDRKFFRIHKCVNPKCPYYLHNLKKVDQKDLAEDYGKNKYKLHYIYREFTVDFFAMDLTSLPKNASSLKFSKHNAHVMSLCLTLHINLGLSLRKTSQALKDLYNINISHQQIANYCKTASICIKPFVDHYDYKPGKVLTADETYIKVRGIKAYIWFIMDAVSRSIIGYQVSDNRSVGPCILAMRMAFRHFDKLPKNFKFIADGYSAYPLAAMEFAQRFKDTFTFNITQVIGLTNDDEVSKEFRPFKQMIERLNRTYKASYRPTNGFDNYDGANYDLALWVAYYNFLRPHKHNKYQVLNKVDMLTNADNMPGKWQLLIFLGQQTILNLPAEGSNCS